ncbi:gamma-tubulin complex component 2 [Lactuca sativa]|uniref:gamma-tubulin complex component 2 n=1 Tax=Lactuca sativa TaxID=4236 RepID=UPI000CD9BD82|nr:gamma-tubulin complex component 2 [Lactuca sativa]
MQYAMCLIFDLIELQDDVLVSFMGIARDELDKTPNEISFEKLQDTGFLLKRLSILKDLQTCGETISKPDVVEEPLITGMETFSVNYKVQWELSLVISRKALTKYQLIF